MSFEGKRRKRATLEALGLDLGEVQYKEPKKSLTKEFRNRLDALSSEVPGSTQIASLRQRLSYYFTPPGCRAIVSSMPPLEVGAWVCLGEQVGQISKLDSTGKCAVAIVNGPTKVRTTIPHTPVALLYFILLCLRCVRSGAPSTTCAPSLAHRAWKRIK